MNFSMEPGRYVVAVSGGVDSCVLLHLLHGQNQHELVVAHYDHGMRPDSAADTTFVATLAEQYGLEFMAEEGRLGPEASEATARQARYGFLYRTQQIYNADAIVTAHHQDDLLETAIINMLRGSGRKGLTALRDRKELRRPLLQIPKAELVAYAEANKLSWREDSTNSDESYLRNYVRRRLLPRFDEASQAQLLHIIAKLQPVNDELDQLLDEVIAKQPDGSLNRGWFNTLPHTVAREVMAAWLRAHNIRDFDRQTLERLVVAGKVTQPGKQVDILHKVRLKVGKDNLALNGLER